MVSTLIHLQMETRVAEVWLDGRGGLSKEAPYRTALAIDEHDTFAMVRVLRGSMRRQRSPRRSPNESSQRTSAVDAEHGSGKRRARPD